MKISTKTRNFGIAAALVAVAASVSAAEGTQDFKDEVLSARSRAEVQAELASARADGQLAQRGETYGSFDPREVTSALTRAEVLADLELWRESGMAELTRPGIGEDIYDFYSVRHRQANARYLALRASPRYAQLVRQIAEQRGDVAAAVPVATRAN